jgi:hypothetical protein
LTKIYAWLNLKIRAFIQEKVILDTSFLIAVNMPTMIDLGIMDLSKIY